MNSQFSLLADRRFLPLFATQFLGAFNDNAMKSFVVVMIAYAIWNSSPFRPEVLVSISAAIFILPFVIFCPIAGMITDKYDKSRVIQYTKIFEILIVLLGITTIYIESILLALVILFALGVQSAFFSPGKFSILPQHLKKDELIGANGLISTGTYLAILAGSIFGTLIALKPFDKEIVSAVMLLCAACGYIASRSIPSAPSKNPDTVISKNPVKAGYVILYSTFQSKYGLLWAILSVSWFYFVAATIHAQFPNFVKQSLHADTNVLTIFMITFSLGIAFGGLLNNRLLQSKISTKLVPFASIAITVFSLDIYLAAHSFQNTFDTEGLLTPDVFFQSFTAWRIFADIFLLSMAGGLYIVPLRSLIQSRTPQSETARVVASNSLTDSLFILASSILATLLLSMGLFVKDLFLILSCSNAFVAVFLIKYRNFEF